MKTHYYLFTIGCLFLASSSCKETYQKEQMQVSEEVDSLSFEQVEKKIKEEEQAKIYKIEKKALVFFMIDREEAKNLTRELGDSYRWETDYLFTSFVRQSQDFIKLARKHNIHAELVHNERFQIVKNDSSSVFFDRIKEDQIMGEIISDGEQEPIITYGMYRNKELAKVLREYFKIKELGYVPPDSLFLPPEDEPQVDTMVVTEAP